jgi:hypothetical protein
MTLPPACPHCRRPMARLGDWTWLRHPDPALVGVTHTVWGCETGHRGAKLKVTP